MDMIVNHPNYKGLPIKKKLAIHPTKQKVYQICGKSMSLYYYPNANFLIFSHKIFL